MTGLKFVPTTENIERRTRHNGTVWNATDDEMMDDALLSIHVLRDALSNLERRLRTGKPDWEMCHNLSKMKYDVQYMDSYLREQTH